MENKQQKNALAALDRIAKTLAQPANLMKYDAGDIVADIPAVLENYLDGVAHTEVVGTDFADSLDKAVENVAYAGYGRPDSGLESLKDRLRYIDCAFDWEYAVVFCPQDDSITIVYSGNFGAAAANSLRKSIDYYTEGNRWNDIEIVALEELPE